MKTDSNYLTFFNHKSVMTNEVMNSVNHCPGVESKEFTGIDATLGGGGHSYNLLKNYPNLNIIGIDQDPYAREASKIYLKDFENRIRIEALNFANFRPEKKVSFIIADLGVSSHQLDNGERGFSFQKDGPLDMRMDPSSNITARQLIKNLKEEELANIIYEYGDEKNSRKIARKIKRDIREMGEYKSTKELAYAIAGCFPPKRRYQRIHPATKTFQALRIAVNDEIKVLETFLSNAPLWLLPGGTLTIISFHSNEDRKVKEHFKNDPRLFNLTKKPLIPSDNEIENNRRSRSAKMRIAKLI
tara:strand:- start:574 stop:1476 length:903 start_codon:yes stop_codon:yes gene_type:complete